jgi:riboflavin synthase
MVDGDHDQFRADVVPETLRRTNLGTLRPGAPVNLELPATVQTLLDGHLVQGHIDATTEVIERVDAADSSEIIFRFPAGLERLIAEKGSIAIDGTSLTVAEVDDGRGFFRVAVIPTTLERTVAGTYSAGSVVNVEVDVIARYTQRLLGVGLE